MGWTNVWARSSVRNEGRDGRGLNAGRVYADRTRSFAGESNPARCPTNCGVRGGVEGKLFSGDPRLDPVALLNDRAPSSANNAPCASGDRGVDCGGVKRFCPTSTDVLSRGKDADR